ncbi:NAD(P)H-dependent glycerol-3-phosphate dehydrogenase [bacterium]|nr:NAD(P)H-dependent glycerol-3-phosphate dehydrogenase [bacterium]
MKAKIGILGAGGWGTALALLLHSNGHTVSLWEYRDEAVQKLIETRENRDFLPGVSIPEAIHISSHLATVVFDKALIVVALPSHVVRAVCEQLSDFPLDRVIVVSGSKGIENRTLCRMSEIFIDTLKHLTEDQIVVLSGPSHAEEVGRKMPTVVVAASKNPASSKTIQDVFKSPTFRVYTNDDVVGVELGGSLKNIIAIAAGISDGVGFGDNTKAALIDRGIVEITRLGVAMGANPLTFAGLSGMGDLIVTCMSRHSRNRYLGEQIGKGKKLQKVLNEMIMVAEGVKTTRSAMDLSKKYQVDMPITHEVYQVLFEDKEPKEAVYDLMTRESKAEDWG